jgi:predicted phage tail protein
MALNLDEKRRTAVKPEAAAAPFISFMIGEVITSTGWRLVAQLALAILLGIFIYKTRPKAEKQKYGWQAGSNSAGVGEAVPVVYGTHKAYGHVLQSSVVTSGDKQWAEILMAVSEGWIHGIRDVRINDQPVENFKPVDGLPSVVYQTRTGTEGQGPISWFKGVNNSRAVNRPLADGTETVWTTLADDVTNFNVTIAFNSGLYHMESDGDISDNSVAFGIKYRRYGDSAWSAEKFCPVTSKARTRLVKVYHSYEFEDPKVPIDKGKWDICIRRLAPAEVRSRFGHYEPRRVCDDGGCWTENVWIEPPIERNINSPSDSVIEYVDEINLDLVPKYPNTALLGVRILASQIMNGSFPNISCVVEGRQFSIRKDGVWADPGGAVDNPAWVVYDLMTNKRFGLGNYIRTADLDLDSFEQFAAYCDEQVPIDNGNGVTTWEKRHTCNIILDQAEPALDVIHKILSSCRGLLVESDGKYRLVAEAPGNVTQIFTMGNIVKDSFQTHWASTKEEYNTVEVQYFDAVKEYERCTVRYSNHPTDPKLLPNNAKVAQVELPGVTRYSQAKREANYRLNMVTSLSQSVEFDAALDAIACRVGDIIGVSHDVPQWGYSGRLRSLISGTTSTLVVDRTDLPYDPAKTYEIWLRSVDDATILPYPVVSVDGNTLQVSGAVPVLPEGSKPQDIVYAFGEVDKSVKLFRVMSITLNEDLTRHVSAAEYSAAVYYETPIALDELPVASYSKFSTSLILILHK